MGQSSGFGFGSATVENQDGSKENIYQRNSVELESKNIYLIGLFLYTYARTLYIAANFEKCTSFVKV